MSELLTIEEVATILHVSPDTATRRFAKVKGVIDIGSPETPRRRRYRVLRIPKTVVEKYLLARGGPVDIKTPTRPQKPSKSKMKPTLDEDEIVRQLTRMTKQRGAEAQKTLDKIAERARLLAFVPVLQRGAEAQKTLDKIAERARLLAFVPESQWSDVVWLDEVE